MTGLDWILIFTAAIITAIQTIRGTKDFDLVLFEMFTVIISAFLATKGFQWLTDISGISPMVVFIFLYVIIELILLVIANAIARVTEFNWPPFDSILSLFFGVITSWACFYALLRAAALGKLLFISQATIDKSPIAKEILNFNILHAIIDFLNKLGT
jgi:hypothetical protein